MFNRIGALSNLVFSKYFVDYLGFDDDEGMYFFEIVKGTRASKLLKGKRLLDYPNLFKYWVREVLVAFSDLAYRCQF